MTDEEICEVFNQADPGANVKPRRSKMKMSLAAALRSKAELVNEIQLTQSRVSEYSVYTEGHEVYSQSDYDNMQKRLGILRINLIKLKIAIDNGNHVEMEGDTVYKLILTRGETKSNLDFTQQLRNVIVSSCRPQYGYSHSEDAPKQKARANVKDLDAELDLLRAQLRKIDNRISDLNGKIQIEVEVS